MPLQVELPLTLALAAALALGLAAQSPQPAPAAKTKEVAMTTTAKGSFTVALEPLTDSARKPGWAPGRMTIDKQFQGDLAGTSQGEMMTAMSDVKGSGGYAAFERFQGTLGGRQGTFFLQHHGQMSHGAPGEWIVSVVPDSGTEGLIGLSGRMTITITGKDHTYSFEYSLPGTP